MSFVRDTLDTGIFRHVIYREASAVSTDVLHIYLEGDGLPFVERTVVSRDPTPDTLVMLELMGIDAVTSVYLGRPCYFGLFADSGCNAYFWTNGRYADVVVTSIATAIRRIRAEYGNPATLRLFGHSGGGSLALLAGSRIAEVETVVTIGANLDINAWADYHDYTRLKGSLNPVELATRQDLQAIHLVGSEDRIAPPTLVMKAGGAMSHEVRVVPDAEHACCWTQPWIEILIELNVSSNGTASGNEAR